MKFKDYLKESANPKASKELNKLSQKYSFSFDSDGSVLVFRGRNQGSMIGAFDNFDSLLESGIMK